MRDSDDAPFYSIDKSMKSGKTRPASTEKPAKSQRTREKAMERETEKRASTSSHPTKKEAAIARHGTKETAEINLSESEEEEFLVEATAAVAERKNRSKR